MYYGFIPSPLRVLPLEKGEISSLSKGSPEVRGDGLEKYTTYSHNLMVLVTPPQGGKFCQPIAFQAIWTSLILS
ncbi:MAG: hypothetical protein Q8M44_04745 [bacterium]|nr:hypothetical protein [bacterium]